MREGRTDDEELIQRLIVEHRKRRFHEQARKFRQRMDERGLTREDLLEG